MILLIAGLARSGAWAQTSVIRGKITCSDSSHAENVLVALKDTRFSAESGPDGRYEIRKVPFGTYTLIFVCPGSMPTEMSIQVSDVKTEADVVLQPLPATDMEEVRVLAQLEKSLGIERLQSLQNFTVYEGKKNEVVLLRNIIANTASNNARQLYGSITGLNIWESDGAGLQLGIGGRGLSPNRTANFNTRQNGYDISADALGYPESYYTPPAEALERIETIRGAAGLQYGTQFGGMVNFQFKQGRKDVPFEFISRQTYGSWNFINSFNSIGGTSENRRFSYYGFVQRKQGNGWRQNGRFGLTNVYGQASWQLGIRSSINMEFTHMDYLARQAGGLTDAMFAADPRQSVRSRNWFKVNWNLGSVSFTHKFNATAQINLRTFVLHAGRSAVGNLDRINVYDFPGNRTLIDGLFRNAGAELRFFKRYRLAGRTNTLLAGARVYYGQTTARQGDADSTTAPVFNFINPGNLEGSDYAFPNRNFALFAEHIFKLSERWSLTPGVRFENIQTFSRGYYRQRVFDFAGNIIVDRRIYENLERKRAFIIGGVGTNYKLRKTVEFYGNISQNYRAINFSDLRIQNPNFVIDSNITDERGFTADAGIRGSLKNVVSYEITLFYLYYNNRIGQILRADQPPLYSDYRFRTNVAASRNMGLESFVTVNLARLGAWMPKQTDWTVFLNASVLNARYINSKDAAIEGNEVEMVPPVIIRSGMAYKRPSWRVGFQINHVGRHFSDATNAERTSTAVEGIIPAYTVADLTASWVVSRKFSFEFSCNNLFNQMYFTRRAEAYPGPGIIPSEGRSFFITAQLSLQAAHRRK